MARSINSPGVQIIETDLSQFQQLGGPTTVYVPGFASQGPSDEVLLISTASELETVYGIPETPAERYFHYTCKEILNSPATLLTTRLPYGSGSGNDFASQYSALFYPVASAEGGNFYIGQPIHKNLTEDQYNNFLQNNISWSTIASGTSANAGTATYNGNQVNAGIVVLNTAQTTVNEYFEGYYIAITDNIEIGVDTDFTAVDTLKSLTATNSFYNVPTTRIGFALSGTKDTLGTNSISEVIERVPTWEFGQDSFRDSVIVTVFKVRNSIYEPQSLVYSLQESFIGSFNNNRKTIEGQTFYLQNVINNKSSNIKVYINPNISERTDWSPTGSTNDPGKFVRLQDENRSLYPVGVYKPTYTYEDSKVVGNVITKLERSLTHIETSETVFVDVVVDGGLSTVFAVTTGSNAQYNDKEFIDKSLLTLENSTVIERWRSVFNVFNNFVSNTRRDCMFIADPLRHIFVTG